MTINRSSTEIPIKVTLYPTITAGAYSAGDVVGGLLSFAFASGRGASGIVRDVRIADDDDEKAACKLWLFERQPTAFADNAAFAPTMADLKYCAGVIAIAAADYTTVNSNAWAGIHEIGYDFTIEQGTLYGYLVCDATQSFTAATDLAITLTAYLI